MEQKLTLDYHKIRTQRTMKVWRGHRKDGEGRVGINVLDVIGRETGQDI